MFYQIQVTNNFQAFLTDLQVTKSFQSIKTFDSILSSGKDHMENVIIISCDLILQMGGWKLWLVVNGANGDS